MARKNQCSTNPIRLEFVCARTAAWPTRSARITSACTVTNTTAPLLQLSCICVTNTKKELNSRLNVEEAFVWTISFSTRWLCQWLTTRSDTIASCRDQARFSTLSYSHIMRRCSTRWTKWTYNLSSPLWWRNSRKTGRDSRVRKQQNCNKNYWITSLWSNLQGSET